MGSHLPVSPNFTNPEDFQHLQYLSCESYHIIKGDINWLGLPLARNYEHTFSFRFVYSRTIKMHPSVG